ncbi:MAG: HEAT repeat domain-containing protein [Planctomycetaceae bacterium]
MTRRRPLPAPTSNCWRSVARSIVVVVWVFCPRDTPANQPPTIDGLTVEQWQQRLQQLDPQSTAAVRYVESLRKLIRDPGVVWYTRRNAALTLARIGPKAEKSVSDLIALLESSESNAVRTRGWSLRALARFGPTAASATPLIVAILNDPMAAPRDRSVCVSALARISVAHPATVPALIEQMQRLADSAIPHTPSSTTDTVLVLEALGAIGGAAAPAVPDLIRATRDSRESVRRTAAQTLGRIGRSAEIAIPCLVELILDDRQPSVRDAAAVALPLTGPRAARTIRFLLKHDDPEVRWRAIDAVPDLSQDQVSCRPRLAQLLNDPVPHIRLRAAQSLWTITGQSDMLLAPLLASLHQSDRQLRMRSLRILVSIGVHEPIVAERLRELLAHRNPKVRQAASSGLRQLERTP